MCLCVLVVAAVGCRCNTQSIVVSVCVLVPVIVSFAG